MSQQKMQLEIILRVSGPGMSPYYRFSLTNQPTEFLSQAIKPINSFLITQTFNVLNF